MNLCEILALDHHFELGQFFIVKKGTKDNEDEIDLIYF